MRLGRAVIVPDLSSNGDRLSSELQAQERYLDESLKKI
jgi:hypothetical protein